MPPKLAPALNATPLTAASIRAIREQADISTARFAGLLNLPVNRLIRLEDGVRQATGPTLALLNVMRRHGMKILLT